MNVPDLPANWDKMSLEQQKLFIQEVKYQWALWARPEQRIPWDDPEWDILLVLAGRGFGKTRLGAEGVREYVASHPGARIGCCSPGYGQAREVQYEGDSGIINVCPGGVGGEVISKYNRSLGQVFFENGSRTQWYSGGDPEKFRGPQHHLIWFDELCAYEFSQETWDMAMMGLRLGEHPRTIITTTPKPTKLIRWLVERAQAGDPKVRLVSGSTFDNAANLPDSMLQALRDRYEGTTLGRQELYAELILDAAGALWSYDLLEECRVERDPELARIVVGVDPAVSAKGDRVNETGIIVAGIGFDQHGYVLEDASIENATPDQWARKVVDLYEKYSADRVIIERNQGGDMVLHTLQTVDDRLPVKAVTASRGKQARAEPIAALYEQHRIHHAGNFPSLENQMTSWVPTETQGKGSPDRVDALVWAMTELMRNTGTGRLITAKNTATKKPGRGRLGRRIPQF